MVERQPLDTAGALVAIRDRLADRFLVLNGDVILDVDPGELMDPGGAWRARLMLTVVDDASAYGAVSREGSSVTAFVEKPDVTGDTGATVNAGLYLMERSVLDELHPRRGSRWNGTSSLASRPLESSPPLSAMVPGSTSARRSGTSRPMGSWPPVGRSSTTSDTRTASC